MAEPYPVIEAHKGLSLEARECLGALVAVAKTLSPWAERVCLVGGWAVYAVTEAFLAGVPDPPLHHRGSLDVDLALGWPELTAADAETITRTLTSAGCRAKEAFRWAKTVAQGREYDVDLMVVPPSEHSLDVVQIGGHAFGPLWNGGVLLRDTSLFTFRVANDSGAGQVPNLL
jgi:hypothetical protein